LCLDRQQSRGLPPDAVSSTNPLGIVDTGFMLTTPLHKFLAAHRDWNNALAFLNSVAILLPSLYVTYVTVWLGDYSLVFRVIFTQLLRSFCGWFTYLPPDPQYLASSYDFPDILECLWQDCSGEPQVLPFVSFFSGHVCTMVLAGNHLWLSNRTRLAVLVHTLNALQIVRLLATRGHYSIDMIIGWYMAVHVSNSAGRLGRYYSRGTPMHELFLPNTAREAFESVTGVSEARHEQRLSYLLQEQEVKDLLIRLGVKEEEEHSHHSVESVTTLRVIHMQVEATARLIQERIQRYNLVLGEKDETKID
jgi:PAP2 superfamily C-terminal